MPRRRQFYSSLQCKLVQALYPRCHSRAHRQRLLSLVNAIRRLHRQDPIGLEKLYNLASRLRATNIGPPLSEAGDAYLRERLARGEN